MYSLVRLFMEFYYKSFGGKQKKYYLCTYYINI